MPERWIIERRTAAGISYVARNERMAEKDNTHWYWSNGDDRLEFASHEAASNFASAYIPAWQHQSLRIKQLEAT